MRHNVRRRELPARSPRSSPTRPPPWRRWRSPCAGATQSSSVRPRRRLVRPSACLRSTTRTRCEGTCPSPSSTVTSCWMTTTSRHRFTRLESSGALGEALVHYYPLAGRLREVEGRKLVVDCTGEGLLFVEADADVRLAELEAAGLRPPFPCMDQLLFDMEGSGGVLNCPVLLIQVTRLLCGGFIFALRLNHTMCDAIGIAQFMDAVAELARGLPAPTLAPVWSRELLEARSPPMPSFPHREFDLLPPPEPPAGDMVMRSFIFGPADLAAIKKRLPPLVRDKATTFEALAAYLWRARTAALEVPLGEDARLVIIANFRAFVELGLPDGYYGNACVPLAALADAAALRGGGSLTDAVALVRRAKAAVTAEYVRSTVDVLVQRGRPFLALRNLFVVSDNRHAGFHRVDFGWGEPVYGGPADTVFGVTFFVPVKDRGGEDAIAVPIVLPRPAMERFAAEMESLCKA